MRWTCKYIFHMGYTVVYNNVQPCHSSFETREDNLNLTLPAKRSSIIMLENMKKVRFGKNRIDCLKKIKPMDLKK